MNREIKIAMVVLQLRVENNNKQIRGKKHAIKSIERYVLGPCSARPCALDEYTLRVAYYKNEGLDKIMDDLRREISQQAHLMNCFSEFSNAARRHGSPMESTTPIPGHPIRLAGGRHEPEYALGFKNIEDIALAPIGVDRSWLSRVHRRRRQI